MRKLLLFCLTWLLGVAVMAQQRVVTGRVTDRDKNAIPNASVLVKGTSNGTSADATGSFSITVPATAKTLVISAIGYTDQEVSIDGKNAISITLDVVDKSLDEVVVVGYQSIKKRDLNGSVSVIDNKEIAQKPISNFTQLLQGKAPGLQVIGQSGQPGQNGYMRIRGTGSINASSEPLIMVDGIAVSSTAFGQINPNDIENISVLKDASAAALYGARAGNGVLVVTTKRGKSGTPEFRYSFQHGFSGLMPMPNMKLMNTREKLQYEFAAGYTNALLDSMIRNRITSGAFPAGTTLQTLTADQRESLWSLMEQRGAGNWGDYYLQDASTDQHEISLSGSSEKIRYFMSLNKYNEKGLVYMSRRGRTGARLNVEYQAYDWLKTGVNLGVTHMNEYQNRELNNVQSPWRAYFTTNPYEPVYMPNGQYNLTLQGFSALEGQERNTATLDRLSTFATAFAEAKPISGLALKTQLALNYNTLKGESYLQPGSNLAAILGYNEKTDNGNQDFQYVSTNTANYNKTFGGIHNIDVLLGQEFTKSNFYSYSLSGRNMPTSTVTTVENASQVQAATTSRNQWSIISYFGSIGYDHNKRYGVKVNARRDGSSRFGANNRFSNFWAVSGWWNLKKESFMDKLDFVSDLKLRSSYGTAGNVPNQIYGSLGTYALNASYNQLPAAIPSQLANPNLTWEKSRTFDIGLEMGFFKNRITATFDYYSRLTDDLLYPKNVSIATGFASVLSNIGSVTNKGFELSVSGDVIRKKDLVWNLSVSYSQNDNKIKSLIAPDLPSTSNTRLTVGEELNTYYMVRWAGINPANGKNQYYKADGSITETYSANDQVLLKGKSPLARFFGSINSTLNYKQFDLSLQFYYNGGNYIYNQVYQNGVGDGANVSSIQNNQFTDVLGYWTKPGDIVQFPSITDASQKVNLTSDKFLQKGDYITLRDLVIGYNMPSDLLKKLRLAGLRFYVQGTNLWVGTKFKGYPEVGFPNREFSTTSYSQPGQVTLYAYPPARTITVGVDIKF
jgi:TonB-linked SusC/RagA family outer membrane protein